MRVSFKILFPQALQLTLLLAIGGFAFVKLDQQSRSLHLTRTQMDSSARLTADLERLQLVTALEVMLFRISKDRQHLYAIAAAEARVIDILQSYRPLVSDEREQQLFTAAKEARERLITSRGILLETVSNGNERQIQGALDRWRIHKNLLNAALDDLAYFNFNRFSAAAEKTEQQTVAVAYLVLYCTVAVIALVILSLLITRRNVTQPLSRLMQGIENIGLGRLDTRVEPGPDRRKGDEFGALNRAFNLMASQLGDINRNLEKRIDERTAQLEASNKELEAFAYSVSHDLRVPLRAIDGFSQMVERRYRDRLDDEGRRLLHVVRDNAQKMGQLIDDILAFSRMGRREVRREKVEMAALVRSAIDVLVPMPAERKFELLIGDLPPAHGDAAMLQQVWVNLIGNAIKFSRASATPRIEIGACQDSGEIAYFVKDNGVGFDMQYAHKLFGVFQRLHGIEEFEGTGIGLAIVKRIITRHEGRVWAVGKVNAGATIYFTLAPATLDAETTDLSGQSGNDDEQ